MTNDMKALIEKLRDMIEADHGFMESYRKEDAATLREAIAILLRHTPVLVDELEPPSTNDDLQAAEPVLPSVEVQMYAQSTNIVE